MFRRLFWIMLVLAVPVVVFDPMFATLVGYSLPGWAIWVAAIIGTVMYAWGGRPFTTGAIDEIKQRQPGMMLLIGLAITVALLASWGSTLGILSAQLDFWWELALLIVIMLLGHWLEMKSIAQTSSALDSLAALLPDEVTKVVGDELVTVSPSELVVGDVFLVRPGESVAADGEVIDGRAAMDESMITGESRAVPRGVGDTVVAGTVATDSGIRVKVTAVGDNTALGGIRRLVTEAQESSSRAQRLADKAAAWLFWFAFGAAVITTIVWSVVGQPDQAVIRAISTLVIACPHALGLAIPLVVSIATGRAARAGVLVTNRMALEQMRDIDAVLFDKTGTLTKGEPVVVDSIAAPGFSVDEVLAWAASAELPSEHPLAKAIVAAAKDQQLALSNPAEFSSEPATGVKAQVGEHQVAVGGPALLESQGVQGLDGLDSWRDAGYTTLHVLVDAKLAGALALTDEVRAESREAVEALHRQGKQVVMITGDAQAVAESVGADLGIDRVFAQVRPEDKAAAVRKLQEEGKKVAFVGDGVNDAPALAQADVGLAIGSGTDVAISSADVVLASSDPRSVLSVMRLSRVTYRKMRQNLWWAAGYNLISVPLAAGVLAPIGFVLPMSIGALLMSLSTVIVALNAQTLRRLELAPDAVVRS